MIQENDRPVGRSSKKGRNIYENRVKEKGNGKIQEKEIRGCAPSKENKKRKESWKNLKEKQDNIGE